MTDEEAGPEVGKEPLTDNTEMLFRQVHPSWVDEGRPTSQAFQPMPKDDGQLSIARGSLTTAEAAYKHHTTVLKLASAGTWAVTVGEADAVGLHSFDDHQEDVPAHGFIDFRGLNRRKAKEKAMTLAARAHDRGRIHP